MGTQNSVPLHPDQESADGLSVISDLFKEAGVCDDYDKFTDAWIFNSKGPDLKPFATTFKRVEIDDDPDSPGTFDVKIVLDAEKVALEYGLESGDNRDRVVNFQRCKFNYEGRTGVTTNYKDHWVGDTPEAVMQHFVSFADPMKVEAYLVLDGVRYADQGYANLISGTIDTVLSYCNRQFTWDSAKRMLSTDAYDEHATFDELYTAMVASVEKAMEVDASLLPPGLTVEKEGRFISKILQKDRVIITDSFSEDKETGTIVRMMSSKILPTMKLKVNQSPLTIDLTFPENGDGSGENGPYNYQGVQHMENAIGAAFESIKKAKGSWGLW